MRYAGGCGNRVKGKVQGVGFRPAVWQIAHQMGLCGDVSNDSEGCLSTFRQMRISPVLSAGCRRSARRWRESTISGSSIIPLNSVRRHLPSPPAERENGYRNYPDAATCDVCLSELFAPQPPLPLSFINCTHCGPRFTIIRECRMIVRIPRCRFFRFVRCVSMNTVTADRRFHAQPNACPDCGPHIWLTDPQQQITARFDDALSAAVRLLKDGKILAMQGLGGFHRWRMHKTVTLWPY